MMTNDFNGYRIGWTKMIGVVMALALAAPSVYAQTVTDVEGFDGVVTRPVEFWSDGTRCAADWFYPKSWREGEKLPALLLSHGYGGTKAGLNAYFSPAFAAAGYAVLCIDYRGWGESDGRLVQVESLPEETDDGFVTVKAREIRSIVRPFDQQTDIDAALSFMEGEPMVDVDRIGIWGTSFAGGHVIYRAGIDGRVKCVVSQVGSQDHMQYIVMEYKAYAEAYAGDENVDTSRERRETLYRQLSKRSGEIERLVFDGKCIERNGLIEAAEGQSVDDAALKLVEEQNKDLKAIYAIIAKTGDYAEPVRWERIQRARGDIAPVPQSGWATGRNNRRYRPTIGDDVQRMQFLPRLYAQMIRVPTLLLDVENEQYIRQGEGIYDILKANNVIASYYVFPGASHYDVYGSLREECARRAVEWYDKHLKPIGQN